MRRNSFIKINNFMSKYFGFYKSIRETSTFKSLKGMRLLFSNDAVILNFTTEIFDVDNHNKFNTNIIGIRVSLLYKIHYENKFYQKLTSLPGIFLFVY